MNRNTALYLSLAVLAALAMVFATVQPAAAQETEVEVTGTVTSIDEGDGSFTIESGDGETITVFPGEEFDFSTLQVGDTVGVTGTLNEDGTVAALEINVEDVEDDETGEGDGPSNGYYCTQSEIPHPFGARLAERYSMDYETLQAWFCDGFGWGQIMLALQTGQITGDDPEALLDARRDGEGWGQIWQRLDLIGRPEHAGPPNDQDGNGRPDNAGPPDGAGPPDWAGPPDGENGNGRPDNAGPPDGAGRPDHAGPPDGTGPPGGRP